MFDLPKLDDGAQTRPAQPSRHELLEQSRLSRVPSAVLVSCVLCKTKLDELNRPLKFAKVCRKCLLGFNTIEDELEAAAKIERRRTVEKMFGGND